jgi:acyl-coenzyme A synthetase/AMP-(fatty) acid ligase
LWLGHPFFPADIDAAIAAMPRPRMLVTTPTHLRVLLEDGTSRAGVDKILSATALLPPELCERAERALGAPLYEIYGSTETGQIASRRSQQTRHWRLFPGVRIQMRADLAWVHGGHVLQETQLTDTLQIVDPEHFDLLGRSSDMINIAGKRSSLASLNHILLSVPGVSDGCMFVPEAQVAAGPQAAAFPDSARLCAVVVAPQLDVAQLLRELRKRIDPAFLPRPILLVASLPRNATGKIPRGALLDLLGEHRRRIRKRAK